MKVLLDACVDRHLASNIEGHDVSTAHQMHWSDVRNGALLTLATTNGFDAFVTVDRNLSFQQNLSRYEIAILLLRSRSNRFADLLLLVPALLVAMPVARKGELTIVEQ
jgi:hypothetical protein